MKDNIKDSIKILLVECLALLTIFFVCSCGTLRRHYIYNRYKEETELINRSTVTYSDSSLFRFRISCDSMSMEEMIVATYYGKDSYGNIYTSRKDSIVRKGITKRTATDSIQKVGTDFILDSLAVSKDEIEVSDKEKRNSASSMENLTVVFIGIVFLILFLARYKNLFFSLFKSAL